MGYFKQLEIERGIMIMGNAGIDYGRGKVNIDHSNGIRYGVISMHEVTQAWCDSSEGHYTPTCPYCGSELKKGFEAKRCEHCHKRIDPEMDFDMLEPDYHVYDADGYQCQQSADDPDIFVIKSPYYTYAAFCSPCAPGAGYLMNPFVMSKDMPIDDSLPLGGYAAHAIASGFPMVYCFGHDWYEEQETGNWIDCQYCNGTGYREKSSIPDYQKREKELIESGFVVPFDDNRFICNVCGKNHQTGQIGKVKEMISKAPYPVFSVETGELICA